MALHLRPQFATRRPSYVLSDSNRRAATPSLSQHRLSRAGVRTKPFREAIRVYATQTEPTDTESTEASAAPKVISISDSRGYKRRPQEWIALIANAEFMLHDVQNESLAEQLREKVRHYGSKGKDIDFFLVPEPAWLERRYSEKAKLVGRPCVALVSTDPVWMRFMKTRLDQVMEIRLGDMPRDEVLEAGGEIPEFEKPQIWRAPYSPYSPGWWEAFYPKETPSEEEAVEEGDTESEGV